MKINSTFVFFESYLLPNFEGQIAIRVNKVFDLLRVGGVIETWLNLVFKKVSTSNVCDLIESLQYSSHSHIRYK